MHDLKPHRRVPEGVDAQSWLGFESRIKQRRFAVLSAIIDGSVRTGDLVSARAALKEACELRPDAPELLTLQLKVLAVQPERPDRSLLTRGAGAVALLALGVSMLVALEYTQGSGTGVDLPGAIAERPSLVAMSGPGGSPSLPDAPALSPDPAASPTPITVRTTPKDPPAPPRVVPVPRPASTTPTASAARVEAAHAATARAERPRAEPARPATASVSRPAAAIVSNPPAPGVPHLEPPAPNAETDDRAHRMTTPPEVLSEGKPADVAPRTASATRPSPPVVTSGPTPAVAVTKPDDDESRVADVLRRYANAYGKLDAGAAREVWPSVDQRALARAFGSLRSQELSMQDCRIDVRGATANASCRGQAQYVGKVGSGEPRIEPRTWLFELRRDGDAWKIANAEARRPTS